ncbi:DUF7667 family protein [Paenibacillus donghaensis]|uniref:Uncharacterized protein n=1 Tax=Paenibacillus donghaensis TaxID=414771 RepID=A0A2Z2KDX3_9BACL|nr:hypothetical protein [Paenibacillus donghaensis]ASA22045.1 hypothetical protein B9T62_15435 [Paenibacillus donghaensis]
MITIHPTHRRLAELYLQYMAGTLKDIQAAELLHFLKLNADLVRDIDGLKEAAYAAQCAGNMDLVQHFCELIDEMEAALYETCCTEDIGAAIEGVHVALQAIGEQRSQVWSYQDGYQVGAHVQQQPGATYPGLGYGGEAVGGLRINQQVEPQDLEFEPYAHKLRLMLDRQAIINGRVVVDEPEAAVGWLDKEIAEMEGDEHEHSAIR